jgi:hypothetical protein
MSSRPRQFVFPAGYSAFPLAAAGGSAGDGADFTASP